jgi:hypothetical protein
LNRSRTCELACYGERETRDLATVQKRNFITAGVAHNMWFTYYVQMKRNLTLAIDDRIVKEARKIALDRETTLTKLVRDYLEKLVAENSSTEKQRAVDQLNESFKRYQVHVGKRTWNRADLHERT